MTMTLESFEALGPWGWVIFGIILCAAELTVPGAFLVWIGFASMAVGLVNMATPVPTVWNLVMFSIFAIGFVIIGRMIYGGAEQNADGAQLNQRARALVGRNFRLDQEISAGMGRIRVDDSVWRVSGPALASGVEVKVVGVAADGVTLMVEKA